MQASPTLRSNNRVPTTLEAPAEPRFAGLQVSARTLCHASPSGRVWTGSGPSEHPQVSSQCEQQVHKDREPGGQRCGLVAPERARMNQVDLRDPPPPCVHRQPTWRRCSQSPIPASAAGATSRSSGESGTASTSPSRRQESGECVLEMRGNSGADSIEPACPGKALDLSGAALLAFSRWSCLGEAAFVSHQSSPPALISHPLPRPPLPLQHQVLRAHCLARISHPLRGVWRA